MYDGEQTVAAHLLLETKETESNNKESRVESGVLIEDSLVCPEGGLHGWLAVFASFMIQFMTVGILSTFGVYQQLYIADPTTYIGDHSLVAVAFIGSIGNSGIGLFGMSSGYLSEKFGYTAVSMAGGLLCAISLILASFSTKYYQLFLTQGLLFSIGYPLAYFPCINIISHWFEKKRGLAMGIATSGVGFGGLALAPFTHYLITNYGVPWALRIIGILCGVVVISASSIMKTRLVNPKVSTFQLKNAIKDPDFIRMFMLPFFVGFAYFVPFAFLPSYAVQYGLSAGQGALIVAMVNLANGLGRAFLGIAADYIGPVNGLLLSCVIAGLSTLLIWPFAFTIGPIFTFAIMYGFWIGGYFSLMPVAVLRLLGSENLAAKTGSVYGGLFFGHLLGAPIVAMILQGSRTTLNGVEVPYYAAGALFSGLCIMIGSASVLSAKLSRGKFTMKI